MLRSQKSIDTETVISCHHLSYKVDIKPEGKCKCRATDEKIILNDINGIFKPGMNAIMGATGSGKTSLLDVLAGRKDPSGITGHILVNGAKQPKNFKVMTGYVVQDDVVMGTLTVRENLMFSANMRLSNEAYTQDQKQKLVNDTIIELGLERCADTKVGNQFIRGVSGGERKRTNIGMELIISPSLLFLDEPTSGLDANTANSVLRLLSGISKKGKTIVFSIHQPRYTIYSLFDRLFLLSKGRTVYHGPSNEALDYFKGQGYICEAHNNPPDFFLDVINHDPTIKRVATDLANGTTEISDTQHGSVNIAFEGDSKGLELSDMENGKARGPVSPEEDPLPEYYQQSSYCQRVDEELEPIFKEFKSDDREEGPRGEYVTSYYTQMKYLSKRTVMNIARNPAATVLQVVVMIVMAFIIGLLFLDIDDKVPNALQNRNGFMFFCIMFMVFSNMQAVELFITERLMYIHEYSNGFYRTSCYFVTKMLFDFIPLRVLPVIVYAIVAYFMAGLRAEAGRFFFFTLTLLLASLVAAAISLAVGAGTGIYAVANILVTLVYVMSMIFGGFFVNLDSVWVGIRWLQYFSLFKYANTALIINEYKGLDLKTETENGDTIKVRAGEVYLEEQEIDYKNDWDLWQNIFALIVLLIGILALAYVQLRRINKYR